MSLKGIVAALSGEVKASPTPISPTWASEDSGFIAHKKNLHEEGLHRIEEERHDYDYNIEACSRTIQLLEPLAQSLRRLSEQEQLAFKLPPGLGGQSETIYKRVIMKLYGREKGQDVIQQLHIQIRQKFSHTACVIYFRPGKDGPETAHLRHSPDLCKW